MKRLLIFLGASALIVIASWAAMRNPNPADALKSGDTPSCCHAAPNRASSLTAK